MHQNHGFIADDLAPEQYVMGGYTKLAGIPVLPGGHWTPYIPTDDELQERNGLETMNCSNYGTLNCLETLLYKKYTLRFDGSERYTGVMTGTTPEGNSPHKVIETIRTDCGLIAEQYLPFDQHIHVWEEYYAPNPMSAFLLKMGKEFLTQWQIGHEWVFTSGALKDKQQKLLEALQYSPIGVSVDAWQEDNGLYVKDVGADDNHWVMLYDYVEGEYWNILDQYDNTHKKLAWDYDFRFAKRYDITMLPQVPLHAWQTYLTEKVQDLITRVQQLIAQLMHENPTPPLENARLKLYNAAVMALGQDLTPQDEVADDVACAASLSALLQKLYPDFPMIPGTASLKAHFDTDRRFKKTNLPKPGNIIISPTKDGGTIHGHCGVFLDNEEIVSNASKGGLWTQNFTLKSWITRYRGLGALPIYFYELV
jgi:hypothetical protein